MRLIQLKQNGLIKGYRLNFKKSEIEAQRLDSSRQPQHWDYKNTYIDY